jgi:uncharacterized coiled-coil DUF342 family protein
MALPIFARLTGQIEEIDAELKRLLDGHATQQRARTAAPRFYSEYVHSGALGQGISAVYSGMEKIMESIVSEIDDYKIKGENYHEKLIEQLAVPVDRVREAMISADLLPELQKLRGFRHVMRHNYPGRLEHDKVLENLARTKSAVKLFHRDYDRLRKSLEAEEPDTASRRKTKLRR